VLLLVATVPSSILAICVLASFEGLLERDAVLAVKVTARCGLAFMVAWVYADLLLFRLMAIHLSVGIRRLGDGGFKQLMLNVVGLGINNRQMWLWLLGFIVVMVIGIGIVRGARRLSERSPWFVSIRQVVWLICLCAFVSSGVNIWQQFSGGGHHAWQELRRVTLFYFTLYDKSPGVRYSNARLRPIHSTQNGKSDLVVSNLSSNRLPDIFLFVLESTRGDYAHSPVTPNIERFRKDCLSFQDTLANSDVSHLSVYTLLTGNYPIYFAMDQRRQPHSGSGALLSLRDLGYKIYLLSSWQFSYRNLDKLLLGDNLELADVLYDGRARSLAGKDTPERDRGITDNLLKEMDGPPGSRLFVVFYQSSHHDYDWPTNYPSRFVPFAESWNYMNFKIHRDELELIKNRYRNSLNYVDSLFGEVRAKLERQNQYEDSIIIVTGDHGEEFLEHGKMVHASETCRAQTHVPICMKLPGGAMRPENMETKLPIASHADVLPTLLDYLGKPYLQCDGTSLFRKVQNETVLAGDNGGWDPYQFCLQTAECKAWFQYKVDSRSISSECEIYLQKITDTNDQALSINPRSSEGKRFVRQHFGALLESLFPGIQL